MVYRGTQIHPNVKYWVRPDVENRIKSGEITAYFNSRLLEIGPDFVVVDSPRGSCAWRMTSLSPSPDITRL